MLPNQTFPGLSNGFVPSVRPWVLKDFGEDTRDLGFIVHNSAGVGMIRIRTIFTQTLASELNGVDLAVQENTRTQILQMGNSL